MIAGATGPLTADDLLRLYAEGVRGELIRGVLCETGPSGVEHGQIAAKLSYLLGCSVWPRRLGVLVTSGSGVLLERDPDTVREPDVAFTSARRSPPGTRVKGFPEAVPDLVVEIVSPGDSHGEVLGKARMWLGHGVRMAWVVDPDRRTVDVLREDGAVETLSEDDSLDGLDVLPGFSCAVSAVFDA